MKVWHQLLIVQLLGAGFSATAFSEKHTKCILEDEMGHQWDRRLRRGWKNKNGCYLSGGWHQYVMDKVLDQMIVASFMLRLLFRVLYIAVFNYLCIWTVWISISSCFHGFLRSGKHCDALDAWTLNAEIGIFWELHMLLMFEFLQCVNLS